MKPYEHAKNSVQRWGGKPEDYLPIHDFLDSSKAAFPDMRHRAILHNSFGCFVAERLFGHNITITGGKLVSVRDIAEKHILEDMGFIPTLQDYLAGMPFYDWLGGSKKGKGTPESIGPALEAFQKLKKEPEPERMVFDGSRPLFEKTQLKLPKQRKPGYLD